MDVCSENAIFLSNAVGIEFAADGSWYNLYGQGPTLDRGTAPEAHETWKVDPSSSEGSGRYLLYVTMTTQGGNGGNVTFSQSPRMLHLDAIVPPNFAYLRIGDAQ